MTDGIIQKVIEKYRLMATFEIEDMKQELIEEIKNEYLGYSSQTNKKILIGGKK